MGSTSNGTGYDTYYAGSISNGYYKDWWYYYVNSTASYTTKYKSAAYGGYKYYNTLSGDVSYGAGVYTAYSIYNQPTPTFLGWNQSSPFSIYTLTLQYGKGGPGIYFMNPAYIVDGSDIQYMVDYVYTYRAYFAHGVYQMCNGPVDNISTYKYYQYSDMYSQFGDYYSRYLMTNISPSALAYAYVTYYITTYHTAYRYFLIQGSSKYYYGTYCYFNYYKYSYITRMYCINYKYTAYYEISSYTRNYSTYYYNEKAYKYYYGYYTYTKYKYYYGYYYYYTGPFTDTTYFYNRSYIKG